MSPLFRSAIVFLGAGFGGVARYWLGLWIFNRTEIAFPLGTMTINVTGSLLIGLVMGFLTSNPGSENWRLLLVVGLLGGYTTFSSFSYELAGLLQNRSYVYAAVYAFGSLLLGLIAAILGLGMARALIKS